MRAGMKKEKKGARKKQGWEKIGEEEEKEGE